VDTQTIEAYNQEAEKIAELHVNLIPERLYQLMRQFFIQGGRTGDIGCGIGRDSAWLSQQGFQVIGIDASIGMLNQAKTRYPRLNFVQAELPELSGIADDVFDNILCSAVLMHLNWEVLPLAINNLLRVLSQDGVVILSFRETNTVDRRENGKLYESIDPKEMIHWFQQQGCELLLFESSLEEGRNHLWHNLVFRKSPCPVESVPICW
jgi:ubiquinone/menaquinone biosynthesis C-methylase UbiE